MHLNRCEMYLHDAAKNNTHKKEKKTDLPGEAENRPTRKKS